MTRAEIVAEAVRAKAQPHGIPLSMMKEDERSRWIAGGEAALAVLSHDPAECPSCRCERGSDDVA